MAVVRRYYESIDQATRAYQALLNVGYNKNLVAFIKDTSNPDFNSTENLNLSDIFPIRTSLRDDIKKHFFKLGPGTSMVAIETPYGGTAKAMRMLDRFNPISLSEDETTSYQEQLISEQAAPFSDAIGLSTLCDSSYTMSSYFGLNTLTNKTSYLPIFGELARSDYSFFGMFGLPSLTNNAAPYSAFFGKPLMQDRTGAGRIR